MTISNQSQSNYAEIRTKTGEKKDEENSDENDSANFQGEDVFVSVVGEFGKYQMLNVFLMGFAGLVFSLMTYSNKFVHYKVDYWCSKVRRFIQKKSYVTIFFSSSIKNLHTISIFCILSIQANQQIKSNYKGQ